MGTYSTKTIRDIAVESPETVRVFEEFKIDYCCGGRKPFDQACAEAGVDPGAVSEKLDMALAPDTARIAVKTDPVPEQMGIIDLVNHIIDKHHTFTRKELTRLDALMAKVLSRHGENHPELAELSSLFGSLQGELLPHLQKEEEILFPYLFRLQTAEKVGGGVPFGPFGSIENPIRVMMSEHEAAGELLARMRRAANDYVPPQDACPSYSGLYCGLKELERDLHQHIHLESNVLFPEALATLERLKTAGVH